MKPLEMNEEKRINFNSTNYRFMLKFKHFDSYLYGSQQLVDFVELRKFLAKRGKNRDKPLELVFYCINETEHEQESKVKRYEFPPLVRPLQYQPHQGDRRLSLFKGDGNNRRSSRGTIMRAHT